MLHTASTTDQLWKGVDSREAISPISQRQPETLLRVEDPGFILSRDSVKFTMGLALLSY